MNRADMLSACDFPLIIKLSIIHDLQLGSTHSIEPSWIIRTYIITL
ncbi:MAG: hypothetical protein GWO79_00515 [Actinobacteria bacterium]|nr:hypothetical protein [Actinomycetota bacterium]